MKSLASHFDDFEHIEDIRSRRSGGHYYIDIILDFDPDLKISEFHQISIKIKSVINAELPGAIITIEPSI